MHVSTKNKVGMLQNFLLFNHQIDDNNSPSTCVSQGELKTESNTPVLDKDIICILDYHPLIFSKSTRCNDTESFALDSNYQAYCESNLDISLILD